MYTEGINIFAQRASNWTSTARSAHRMESILSATECLASLMNVVGPLLVLEGLLVLATGGATQLVFAGIFLHLSLSVAGGVVLRLLRVRRAGDRFFRHSRWIS
jgi:hypothetical protein